MAAEEWPISNLCLSQIKKNHSQVTFSIVYEALFARFLIIGHQPNIQLLSVFQYKISSVPHSLVDEFGYLLKGDKSVLMKRLGSDSESVPNVLLADHIVWRTSGTVADIAESCKACLTSGEKYQGATIFIIFARWAYEELSAKDHEQQRRAGEGAAIYQLTLTSPLPPRDAIKPSQQVPAESISLQFQSCTQHQHGGQRKLSCTSQ